MRARLHVMWRIVTLDGTDFRQKLRVRISDNIFAANRCVIPARIKK